MVNVGFRPILWHIMKYYAHHGHKEFILCLGYKADVVKSFFLNYEEGISNDFTLSNGRKQFHQKQSDISDWSITCVDTGLRANIGQRLKAVQSYLGDDEYFLANYADALTDLDLPTQINRLQRSGKVASCLCVKPSQTFSIVSLSPAGSRNPLDDCEDCQDPYVEKIEFVQNTDLLINGGYFVFRRDIFQYMKDGEELVAEPFQRLIKARQLLALPYDKFWYCMDTFKEQQELNDMFERGEAPWVVWKNDESASSSPVTVRM